MDEREMLNTIRGALGRRNPLDKPPIPPVIDEPITRRVHTDIGLSELFARSAEEMKMQVASVSPEALVGKLVEFLRAGGCTKIALAKSELMDRLGIVAALRSAGFEAKSWDEITLDELYDGYDCGVTDVTYAVAETGSLVIRPTAGHGRAISLVPMVHIAIVEPKVIVADLVDLMEKLAWAERSRSNFILITGPSKTADIEMNVVTGVHGPNVVQVFLLA